ncbi:MAG: hypothetical protein FWH11_12315 [Micrococcales bacterium]|nr:hypothetical protein [Micrococcales bacterium]
MVAQPDLGMTPEPDALYRVSLSGGVEVDYFTDPTGRVCYIETIPGTASVPNPVLDGSQASTTYVVHPADGRYAVVLRTDEQARLVEVVADPLPSVGAYGQDEHPFVALSGAWPGGVSPRALLMSLGGPAAQGLAALGMRLAEAVNHGQHVAAHVQVLYADTGTVPSRLQVDYATDGQTATESFSNV